MELYKLAPAFMDYIWGGTGLIERWGKKAVTPTLAESWELSLHEKGKSRIIGGKEDGRFLADALTKADWGTNGQRFDIFPMMVKLICASQNLSVQVHPSDAYAKVHENSLGKTETWYILEAQPGAGIYCGLTRDITKVELDACLEQNRITDLLHFYPVQPGESYMIPAGTIHAIGAGCTLIEIQQNSDITYRVYDYDRRDDKGNARPLHIEKAKAVSSLKAFCRRDAARELTPGVRLLAASRYFTVYEYDCCGQLNLQVDDRSFVTFTAVEGEGTVNGRPFAKGDSFLAPAAFGALQWEGQCRIILSKLVQYRVECNETQDTAQLAIRSDDGIILAQETLGSPHSITSASIIFILEKLLQAAALTPGDLEEIVLPSSADGKFKREVEEALAVLVRR